MQSSSLRGLWITIAVVLLVRLLAMAWIPLMDTTEGRYGEIGRKMLETGNWVTPWHDHGVPFWGKPPLSFWLTALSYDALGVSALAARLPHWLCGLGILACMASVARRESALHAGLTGAVLVSSLLFFLSMGAVMTDTALLLGTTLAMTQVWWALHADSHQHQRFHGLLAVLGAAIGVLAKGPLALVLIGAPVVAWATLQGEWKRLWTRLPWIFGMALLLLITAPWFVWAELRTPGFWNYFFVGEHFHRFVTPGWSGDLYGNAHQQPKGTIWLYAAQGWMPWTLIVPIAFLIRWRKAGTARPGAIGDRSTTVFIACNALIPLVFFTASSNIISTYALPALPFLAWGAARILAPWGVSSARWATGILIAFAVTAVAGGWFAQKLGRFDRGSAEHLVERCAAEAIRQAERTGHTTATAPVFVGRRSFSGDFYSQGSAERIDDLAGSAALWPQPGRCVAIHKDVVLPLPDTLRVVVDLGLLHDRHLLWLTRIAP